MYSALQRVHQRGAGTPIYVQKRQWKLHQPSDKIEGIGWEFHHGTIRGCSKTGSRNCAVSVQYLTKLLAAANHGRWSSEDRPLQQTPSHLLYDQT